MDSSLSDKLNKEAEKQAIKVGKKVAEKKVHDKLGELDSKTEEHLVGLREKMNAGMVKSGLSLISAVYFLIGLQQLPVLVMLLLVYLFSTILELLLLFVIIIVAVIYLVAYIVIYRFPGMLKGSLGFTLSLLLSICEAIFVAYLCQVISEIWLMVIVVILIIIMLVVTILAKCLKQSYRSTIGIIFGFSITTGIFALYILLIGGDWVTLVISFILTILYQTFLIIIVKRLLNQLEIEEEDFKTAIFVTLLVYKSKIDVTFGSLFLLLKACAKCCKKKENY